MSNIERHGGSTLAITEDQTYWTQNQQAALAQLGLANAPEGDLYVLFHQAQRTQLDPFTREIYMIQRSGKWTIQVGVDGLYKIADRVSERTGGTWSIAETYWCGEDGQWRDVWLSLDPPAAAKVVLERNGSRFVTVALTREYKAPGPMWTKMPARMIAKCAESLALRKAFPKDTSGLYTTEEMAQADNGQQPAPASRTRQQGARSNRDAAMQALQPEPAVADMGDDELAAIIERIEQSTDKDELRGLYNDVKGNQHTDMLHELIVGRVQDIDQPAQDAPVDAEIVDEDAA